MYLLMYHITQRILLNVDTLNLYRGWAIDFKHIHICAFA